MEGMVGYVGAPGYGKVCYGKTCSDTVTLMDHFVPPHSKIKFVEDKKLDR